jgi:opacity protein-like surface antigen
MNFRNLTAITAMALLSCAASVQAADENNYAEIGYTTTKYSGVGAEWTPPALRGVFGSNLHENYAVEAMLLLGLADSSKLGVTIKAESGAGVYFKPKAKLGSHVELFGRIGWANINTQVRSSFGSTTDAADSGLSYGFGAAFTINKAMSINVDYMLYNEDNGSKIDGATVGIGYKF